ncbi:MAG: peptidase S13, partial [Desulfobacterales bacterium]
MHCNIAQKAVAALCLGLFFYLVPAAAGQTEQEIARQYITNGGFQVGEKPLLQYRAEELFIPASTQKILTALLALETLGADFRFTTRLYLDDQHNLYIKGGGDPFLTSEAVLNICQRFHRQYPQITTINTIYLDNSLYQLNGWQVTTEHSDNPYDAPNGALAVNFNSLPITVAADGAISPGEPQTPLLPIMRQKAEQLNLAPGRHRINICYQDQSGYITALHYAAELFTAQLKKYAIRVNGRPQQKKVPAELPPAIIYHSEKTLKEMTALLLHFSNNFIANQIFLAVG